MNVVLVDEGHEFASLYGEDVGDVVMLEDVGVKEASDIVIVHAPLLVTWFKAMRPQRTCGMSL